MRISSHTLLRIRERSVLEFKRYALLVMYLALFLGSFTIYRRLVLRQYDITYLNYGYSLIEAMVLGKVIMVGEMFRLGEKHRDRPLAIPTLYKAVMFSLLVLGFAVVEDQIRGALRGETAIEILRDSFGKGIYEKLARALIIFVAFIPLFAFRELGRLMGAGKLGKIFFRRGPGQETTGAEGRFA